MLPQSTRTDLDLISEWTCPWGIWLQSAPHFREVRMERRKGRGAVHGEEVRELRAQKTKGYHGGA